MLDTIDDGCEGRAFRVIVAVFAVGMREGRKEAKRAHQKLRLAPGVRCGLLLVQTGLQDSRCLSDC